MSESSSRSADAEKKILIVGCGFLGRRAAQRWVATGAHVSALTRSAENACQLRELGIHPLIGDVTQPETLGVLPKVDVVLYSVGLDRASGRSQREVYVNGLEHVLERISGKVDRLIYVSSTSVYGQTRGEWVDEDSPCDPTASNGVVCLEAERLLWRHFAPEKAVPETAALVTDRGEANVLRLAGIYGPGRLIARVASLKSGNELDGNPEAWLNLIHVEDAVSAVFACLQRGAPGRTYLACDDRPVQRREYYETLARLVQASAPRFAAELPDSERRLLNKRCRNRRLRDELQVDLQFPDIATGLPQALVENG